MRRWGSLCNRCVLSIVSRGGLGLHAHREGKGGGGDGRTMLWLADEKNVEGRFAVTRGQDVVDSYVK